MLYNVRVVSWDETVGYRLAAGELPWTMSENRATGRSRCPSCQFLAELVEKWVGNTRHSVHDPTTTPNPEK